MIGLMLGAHGDQRWMIRGEATGGAVQVASTCDALEKS